MSKANFLEEVNNSKVSEYYCRPKVKGWHIHNEMVIFKNGKKDFESIETQIFKNLFHSHNILRPSCHNCKYTNTIRPSDITIADYWGIEKKMPEFDDNKGISLILLNTEKGTTIFNKIKKNLVYHQSNINDCLQPQLQYPSKESIYRKQFWSDYNKKGYSFVIRKYAEYNLKNRTKNNIKLILKKFGIFEIAKRVIR